MAIDRCPHAFSKLAQTVLPAYMRLMRSAMKSSVSLRPFMEMGAGPKGLLRSMGKHEDFPGCYVLIWSGRPRYVGISRTVARRVLQHIRGKTHYDASLAYRMACATVPHTQRRAEAFDDPDFRAAFDRAKKRLAGGRMAAIRIENPLERHLFEAYCAMALGTSAWNTFETH